MLPCACLPVVLRCSCFAPFSAAAVEGYRCGVCRYGGKVASLVCRVQVVCDEGICGDLQIDGAAARFEIFCPEGSNHCGNPTQIKLFQSRQCCDDRGQVR